MRRAYVAPASHCGQYADATLPPYGTRARLKADFSLAPYTGDALVLLTALKTYGLMLADQGSAWYVTGTSDPRVGGRAGSAPGASGARQRLRAARERADDDLLSARSAAQSFRALPSSAGLTAPTPSALPVTTRR